MKMLKNFLLLGCLMFCTSLFAKGGDDVGNGGFAYKQSVIILKMATSALEDKIRVSTLKDLVDYPERRAILEDTLAYDNLEKLSKKNQYRGGKKLAMNYIVNPATVIVLKSYFEAFMGRTDSELEEASLEVQKRLLHEASHIWGYKEADSEKFAVAFLKNINTPPPADENRPSDITIGDFCSCINGKSESTKTCDKFCATKPVINEPILYVNTLLGEESLGKFGSLYNWCTVMLSGDQTTPQCSLQATNGQERTYIPVNIASGSNSFTANIITLSKYKTWDLKLVETKTGSYAKSASFQVKRIDPDISNLPVRKLKVMPVNQYTCLIYGGKVDSQGNVIRTSSVKSFYYFQAIENPRPMPPVGDGVRAIVCHDEQLHPGDDSIEYGRLDTISDYVRFWDVRDMLFATPPRENKLPINKILETRLLDEFGISTTIDLFRMLRFLTRPTIDEASLGYVLLPFYDQNNETNYCPTQKNYTDNNPLLNLLGDYLGDTEALYLAEKEAEVISDGINYRTIYGTVLVRESLINKFGFYIENGLKKMLTEEAKHAGKTIYYYGPVSNTADPLTKGSRKLFTIRSANEINGDVPRGLDLSEKTSDKRIGCIPKGAEL